MNSRPKKVVANIGVAMGSSMRSPGNGSRAPKPLGGVESNTSSSMLLGTVKLR